MLQSLEPDCSPRFQSSRHSGNSVDCPRSASEALVTKTRRLKEKLAKLAEEMRRLALIEAQMLSTPDQ